MIDGRYLSKDGRVTGSVEMLRDNTDVFEREREKRFS